MFSDRTSAPTIQQRHTTKAYIHQVHGFGLAHVRAETAYLDLKELKLLRELFHVDKHDPNLNFSGKHIRDLRRWPEFRSFVDGCLFPEDKLDHYVLDSLKYLRSQHVPYVTSIRCLLALGCSSLKQLNQNIESIKATHKLPDYIAFSFYLLSNRHAKYQELFLQLFHKHNINPLYLLIDLAEYELKEFSELLVMGTSYQNAHQIMLKRQEEFRSFLI